jgi:FAD dependent oxidoreductase TIGR03364
MERSTDIAIVGAGIAGLAHAYFALKKGYRVTLFEREQYAIGASIRNFGLVWPVGQQPGVGFEVALRSRSHWLEVSQQAGFWLNPNGSLHLAYHEDEEAVIREFLAIYKEAGFQCGWLSADEVLDKSPVVKQDGLRGALWSATEGTVYSREAIRRIPAWLQEKFGLQIFFGYAVTAIDVPHVVTSRGIWKAQHVIVCSGADFETLYPQVFDRMDVSKCKLQMLKAIPAEPVTIGPTLCAGLTLRHYASFAPCPSLQALDQRYDALSRRYKDHGIHVLLAQNQYGELIIGDSHHYGRTLEPFDSEEVNDIILEYLSTFTNLGKLQIVERWHGIYPKLLSDIKLVLKPAPGVTLVNGLGGAGMTLSFGIAEEVIEGL